MKVLYIDTSTNYLSTGIVKNDKLLATKYEKLEQNLSRDAVPEIAKMFDEIGMKTKDIDKIIVVDGPGSFTGIRIGVTIAKVYAYALKKNITTISSLEAMQESFDGASYYVPIIDARRGYVYTAIYDKNGKEVFQKQYTKLSVLKDKLKEIGDYLIITNDDIELEGIKVKYKPDVLKIVEKYKGRRNINPHSVNPNYLKLTEAEERLMDSN